MFLPPMLPKERKEPFDDERYIFEPKISGHRLLLSMENGIVRLYTRHGREITAKYPELHQVPLSDYSGTLLDGEVACLDPESGMLEPESDTLTSRIGLTKPMSIREAALARPVHFFVFDILKYRGKDIRDWPLSDRKKALAEALEGNRHISPAIAIEHSGNALYEALRGRGLEGIVAKSLSSPYVGRRNGNWQAIRYYEYAVVQIAGYRKNQFGWLMRHRGRIVGLLENGVPSAHKNAFLGVSKRLATGEDRDYVYVEPAIEARVRYRSRTSSGELAYPEFVDFIVS